MFPSVSLPQLKSEVPYYVDDRRESISLKEYLNPSFVIPRVEKKCIRGSLRHSRQWEPDPGT